MVYGGQIGFHWGPTVETESQETLFQILRNRTGPVLQAGTWQDLMNESALSPVELTRLPLYKLVSVHVRVRVASGHRAW